METDVLLFASISFNMQDNETFVFMFILIYFIGHDFSNVKHEADVISFQIKYVRL